MQHFISTLKDNLNVYILIAYVPSANNYKAFNKVLFILLKRLLTLDLKGLSILEL